MTTKEKASEMVAKQFDIIARATNYQGLKKEGEKKFRAIERVAKDCALIGVESCIKVLEEVSLQESGTTKIDYGQDFWQEVKQEIEKL